MNLNTYSDLARFIAAGRLNFSIDKVNGIVETNRADARNSYYEQVVKQVGCFTFEFSFFPRNSKVT